MNLPTGADGMNDGKPQSPQRPLLAGFYQVVPMGSDGVQVRSAGRTLRLRGDGVGDVAAGILTALDGRSSTAQIADRLAIEPDVVDTLVNRLWSEGIVVDGAEDSWRELHRSTPVDMSGVATDSHIEHMAERGLAPGVVRARLAAANVMIIGAGPVALLVAEHLNDAGVTSRAGHPQSDLSGTTMAIVEVDRSGQAAEAANRACIERGLAFLAYQIGTLEATIGPFVMPHRSPCWMCARSRQLSHLRFYEDEMGYLKALATGSLPDRPAAALSGATAMVAGIVSAQALGQICGLEPPSTSGAVLSIDFRTFETRREPVVIVPDCPACGSSPRDLGMPA